MGRCEILRMEREMKSKDAKKGQVSIMGRCYVRRYWVKDGMVKALRTVFGKGQEQCRSDKQGFRMHSRAYDTGSSVRTSVRMAYQDS
jgi:hypothetical protein